ncbi:MAG TPA: hypothetical protein VHP56_02305 [Solirubrobacterales bacterium]|jgi:hypothetical protein|nr:hypothetical protein [Solirubrobacterales bacterium]
MSGFGLGRRLALPLTAAAMALAALVLSPVADAADGERVFDPQLSLTGGCKVETLDPVEDPGCTTTPPLSAHPPSGFFADPRAVATDIYGNIFVASFGKKEDGSLGRVDVFDPEGVFLSEFKTPFGPKALAVDSKGALYVVVESEGVQRQILRYTPCLPYEPEAGKVEYCNAPTLVAPSGSTFVGLAINADNNHLFANFGGTAVEFTSAEEGNAEVRRTRAEGGCCGTGAAVDAARDWLYVSAEGIDRRVDIFDLGTVVGTPPDDEYKKIGSITDASVPGGDLGNLLSVAVDEETGRVFVFDTENRNLFEFDEDWNYVATVEFPFQPNSASEIAVDNGLLSPNKGYLYVPSHKIGNGHSFAFKESKASPPDVKAPAAVNIGEDEAELVAQISAKNLETTYRIEYTTELGFEAEGFAGAVLAGEGTLPAGNNDVEVSAVATGLEEGTAYRFRVVAENAEGADEEAAAFATYPSAPFGSIPCPNAVLRSGPSALLPDCRAYELVTPPDTNGRPLLGTTREINSFITRQVSPDGGKVPFKVEGGSLPGFNGTGSSLGDPYLATRTSTGWSTSYIGPTGAETVQVTPGSGSPDQGYTFWNAQVAGTAVLGGPTNYVRFPDGHSEVLGQGSLGRIDAGALGQLISEGGTHILFTSRANTGAVQLEPNAAPDGTKSVYDRIPNPVSGERETKVVSLKPGDIPFGAGEDAIYTGASLDGEGVVFRVGSTLYLRYQNSETFEIGDGLTFAGIADGGTRVFYLQGGDLKAFDANSKAVSEFSDSGDVTPVFVAQDGSAAYFLSPSALTAAPNPNGEDPQLGAQNLYLSKEGAISFVGVVTDRDVEGEPISGFETVDGLGLWVVAANPQFPGRFGVVPARSTPDGDVLLFKSRAALSGYDSEGKAQIYRYDSVADRLECLSCNPTGAPSSDDATLQTEKREGIPLFFSQAWLENLRADGKRAFFESSEPLVPGDSDGLKDVYEWEAQGVGTCARPQGCLHLISSPGSLRGEYLWAISPSGDDVFFLSSDLLVGADADLTPSIYDARVGGGFAEASPPICEGEGCRPRLSPPPSLPGADTQVRGAGDNVKPRHCGKGKRQVKRNGKVRCVKKKSHRKQAEKHRAGTGKKGGQR